MFFEDTCSIGLGITSERDILNISSLTKTTFVQEDTFRGHRSYQGVTFWGRYFSLNKNHLNVFQIQISPHHI